MQPAKLRITASVCLLSSALLALAVAHTTVPYSLVNPALEWLGPRSANRAWASVAEILATPVVCVVLVASFVFATFRRAPLRVVVYAAFAGVALLVSEHIDKPLVQRIYDGESTFPSGSVTLASATALAMWLALYPLFRTRARCITGSLGAAWVLLMSLAVVGALWHTPLDVVGSILLSAGIVTAGAAVFESAAFRIPALSGGRARIGERR